MKLTIRAITLLLFLLAAAATASADTISLTINNGGSYSMGGVMVGPYNFTETSPTVQPLNLVCDSYMNEVYPPESWTATTTTVSSLSGVMFSGNGTYSQSQLYQQVAYLVEEMSALPQNSMYAQNLGDLQWAVWDIFDPGVSNGLADASAINALVLSAEANAPGGNYSNLTIYTPVCNAQTPCSQGTPQEYIGITTPEPGSMLLLGTGLFGLLTFRRRSST